MVMHDAGHKHDSTSALHQLWADALEDGETDSSHAPDPVVSADGMSQRPSETQLGTRIPAGVGRCTTPPLALPRIKPSVTGIALPDILIATKGKSRHHGDRIQQFHDRSIHIYFFSYRSAR